MATEALLDAALRKYGSRDWTLQVLTTPTCIAKEEDSIEAPISLATFQARRRARAGWLRRGLRLRSLRSGTV